MQDANGKAALIEDKKRQIMEILCDEDITFGMARTILNAIEAEFLKNGNTFLNRAMFKNVFPCRN